MHGTRRAVYAGEKIRGGREVYSQGPEALSDEEGRGTVGGSDDTVKAKPKARIC